MNIAGTVIQDQPNAITRLRYNSMYLPKIMIMVVLRKVLQKMPI